MMACPGERDSVGDLRGSVVGGGGKQYSRAGGIIALHLLELGGEPAVHRRRTSWLVAARWAGPVRPETLMAA